MATRKTGPDRRIAPQHVYQLLVRLADIDPAIWRRLWVPGMRDPAHEEHGAMWLWWGGPFDPNGFDLNAANLALRRLR